MRWRERGGHEKERERGGEDMRWRERGGHEMERERGGGG